MDNYRKRRMWIFGIVSGILILVLIITLVFLIINKDKLPDNAVLIENGLVEGENLNAEALKKLGALIEKEPVLKKLPMTVEYFSEDGSEYTKYILSYGLDDSERGFYLVMKDYSGAGVGAGIIKLGEMGMQTAGLRLEYTDLSEEMSQGHAE